MARPPPKSINFGDFKTCELTHSIRSDSEHSGQKKSKNIARTIIMYTNGCCKLESTR